MWNSGWSGVGRQVKNKCALGIGWLSVLAPLQGTQEGKVETSPAILVMRWTQVQKPVLTFIQ